MKLLLSVPLIDLCHEDVQSAPSTSNTTGGPKQQQNAGLYSSPTNDPSQQNIPVLVQAQSADAVHKKVSSVPMLFSSTYNLTASGMKRVNVGIEAHHDGIACENRN
ncbi:uncharacterized protein LOC126248742 [Schistocerca nitens]|uniref:uncharacterized protein LOC126248742 n=1 Tax=Schistocerca nitens TaxID=7011 RepID=UPI002119A8F1|nr:uncharacterized protein LOC126248742 [Schistocerca nitens]